MDDASAIVNDADLEKLVEAMVEKKVAARFESVEQRIEQALGALQAKVEADQVTDRLTTVVFSGDMDKLMAAFIIATGASAMGMEVSMFFTYWGLTALRKTTTYSNKNIAEKMMAMMLPPGPHKVPTSSMNMMGMGPVFFKHVMKQNNVESLPSLINVAREMDIRLVACQMSMGIMGIKKEELWDDVEYGGVATYLGDASDSRVTLFI